MGNNKVAIIGGSGFLGSCFSKQLLAKGVEFRIFDICADNEISSEENIDILQDNIGLDLSSFNTLVNLAAEHRDDVVPISRYYDVNVQGAKNICELAELNNINKIVFTSSVAIYGFAPPDTDESGKPNFFNEYGRTKYLAEQIYMEWQQNDPQNRCLVVVRPTVIFGEGNRGNVYNLLNQIASGRFLMFGNGKNKKSMSYVENVAAFLHFCLDFKPGLHIYNYIDKPDLDMNSLISLTRKILFNKYNVGLRLPAFAGMAIGYFADVVAKILGRALPISSIRVKKFMGTTQFSSSVDKTGFIPPFSLEEGLSRTLDYEFLKDNASKKTFKTE